MIEISSIWFILIIFFLVFIVFFGFIWVYVVGEKQRIINQKLITQEEEREYDLRNKTCGEDFLENFDHFLNVDQTSDIKKFDKTLFKRVEVEFNNTNYVCFIENEYKKEEIEKLKMFCPCCECCQNPFSNTTRTILKLLWWMPGYPTSDSMICLKNTFCVTSPRAHLVRNARRRKKKFEKIVKENPSLKKMFKKL